MHPVEKNGKQFKGGLQIKTDARRQSQVSMARPTSKLRCRYWRPGFQTFGADYDIDKPTVDITVRVKLSGGASIPFMKNITGE